MPIKGVLLILLLALIVGGLKREEIYNWISDEFGLDENDSKENDE